MATLVLHAGDPSRVSSPSSFEVELGDPALRLMIFSGMAAPEIDVDDDDDVQRDEVLVKLGANVSAIHAAVTQVGLASISNDESAFVFATDTGTLEIDPATSELQLHVLTAVMGEDSSLHRFSYQVVAHVTKVASQIAGSIRVPHAVLNLTNMERSEVEALFRVTANLVETVPPAPGATPPFSAEKLIPVATGRIIGPSSTGEDSFVEYLIDGCPLNTPLRVVVDVTSRLEGLSAVQVAGPRPVVLTRLAPAVGGVNFAIIVLPLR